MPKILIREKDNTSAGSLGAYSNYSVLIPGFSSRKAPRNEGASYVKPDANNVYELTSIAEFTNMIGDVPLAVASESNLAPEHYGNRMTKLLLEIGYTVLYIDLGYMEAEEGAAEKDVNAAAKAYANALVSVTTEDFWAPFKDRAEYDYRFVYHGLLSSVSSHYTETEKTVDENKIDKLKAGLALIKVKKDEDGKIIPLAYTDIENIFNTFYEVDESGDHKIITAIDAADQTVDFFDEHLEINVASAVKDYFVAKYFIEENDTNADSELDDTEPVPPTKVEDPGEDTGEEDYDNKKEQYEEYLEALSAYKNELEDWRVKKATFDQAVAKLKNILAELNRIRISLYQAQEEYIDRIETNILLYDTFSGEAVAKTFWRGDADEDFQVDTINSTGINSANNAIANLAAYLYDEVTHEPKPNTGRGDCTALIELDEYAYVNEWSGKAVNKIISAVQAFGKKDAVGRYCACTVPSVVYNINSVDVKVPGAMHYLECFASSLAKGYDEWFAAAGFSRGLSAHTVSYTTVKLGDLAVNALEPRFIEDQQTDPPFAVNVIACFRGNYYLWGNRTCEPLGMKEDAKLGNLTAKHFLNIRQLCTTLKKQVYVSCRSFTFDPNSDVLWINFQNAIRPTLERMKANQGIREYKIEKVLTDKKATLAARIRIVPIEAVEDFDIEISLEDSLAGIVVTTAD